MKKNKKKLIKIPKIQVCKNIMFNWKFISNKLLAVSELLLPSIF